MDTSNSQKSLITEIDDLLNSFSRFGVDLGLDRILALLEQLGNPHKRIPIVHVAGTNGKGSVCAYISSILIQAGYRVGRYTSPHLMSWDERICINNQSIDQNELRAILLHIRHLIGDATPSPTQFEVFTAAAWVYFAQESIDIAVIEVGLGGRLDATNVCDRPLVSVITSIGNDHWQRLGPTIADIAREKAGILKPQCPAVIGKLPPSAESAIKRRVEELHCSSFWVQPAQIIDEGYAQFTYPMMLSNQSEMNSELALNADFDPITYPMALLGTHQLMNSALAIAAIHLLRAQGWHISNDDIYQGMAHTNWPGRIQWINWQEYELLVDGAHNADSAITLRNYIDQSDRVSRPVHWVMGMLSTKDHDAIFRALLREGDCLSLVPVPDHSSSDPVELEAIAQRICPNLESCQIFDELFEALKTTIQSVHEKHRYSENNSTTIVLCGSLYLIGYFMRYATKGCWLKN